MEKVKIHIPLTVPRAKEREYLKNINLATCGTGKMMMFAADQKVEHLNDDFVAPGLPSGIADPEHYFKIASQAKIGVFASQMGLISKYGRNYKNINYLIKINSRTNLMKTEIKDPMSSAWLDIDDVIDFKKQSGLKIIGVGYTIYLGSWYEPEMFGQAARLIKHAHQEGLITIIWMYPRGKAVKDEKNIHLIAGGAGVAVCLGADFVKVNHPYTKDSKTACQQFKEVVAAAGRTGVIPVGGTKKEEKNFLASIYDQIHISGTKGCAVGRNIYQRSAPEAIRMANAISSIVLYDYSAADAYDVFLGKKQLAISKPSLCVKA